MINFLGKLSFKEGKVNFIKGITSFVDTPDHTFLVNVLKKMSFDDDKLEAVKILGPHLPPYVNYSQKNEVLNAFSFSNSKDKAKPFLGL